MHLDPDTIRQLAKLTLETRPGEISCEDWIDRVGEYLEATRDGTALDERLLVVRRHGDSCPSCAEELETLRALLEEEAAEQ